MRRYTRVVRHLMLGTAVGLLLSCGTSATPAAPVTVRMDFGRPDFYAAPFPSDDLLAADGHVDISKFPNPSQNLFMSQITALITRDARAFATSGGVFFTLTGDVDPSTLPDLDGSTHPGASAMLVSLDDGKVIPTWVTFTSDGGDYGGAHMISMVPLAGIALAPKQKYAAFVTRGIHDTRGQPIAQSTVLASIEKNVRPPAMPDATFAEYTQALAALQKTGVDASTLAGLTVFTTGDPTAQMLEVARALLEGPVLATKQAPSQGEVFDGFCVFNAQIDMPDYQSGTPPFSTSGGDWAFGANGIIQQRLETASVVVTIPRTAMPANGFPLALMVRTGGGGDRPLVDRGVQAVHDGPPIVAGSGPAMEFAKVGFAGAQVDGPHGGLRNVTHDDEQFLMFNVSNGAALRDNVRESALELAVFERVLENLTIDASACPGTSPSTVHFDASKLALLGHSMGATIAPLVLAIAPAFHAAILSGSGASWIENVAFKEKPVPVRPLIELLLGYSSSHRTLVRGDPVLTLVQWALEPADPLVYGRLLSGRQVLMEQGIVDHYILPPIANATPLSVGLDLAGTELDVTSPELLARPELYPLSSVMKYGGRKALTFPVSANAAPNVTAIVVQHPADGIEDGHEVMFQTEPPKREYRCFLQSYAKGGAALVPDGNVDAPCP